MDPATPPETADGVDSTPALHGLDSATCRALLDRRIPGAAAQKRQIVEQLTEAMVNVEGENMRPVTWCIIEEVQSGDWGIGGNPLTTADVKHLAAGQTASA